MTADRSPPVERANAWADGAPRMRELRHVHAEHDPRAWHWFARGPVVAADGGRRGSAERRADRRDVEDEQLRDVSHTPPAGESANRVWERGEEAAAEAEAEAEPEAAAADEPESEPLSPPDADEASE